MSAVRVAFVLSERAEGLGPARMAGYREVERSLAALADADVTTVHYADIERVEADATVLSGSYDPWASHDPQALTRLRDDLRGRDGPILGICAGMQLLATAAGADVAAAHRPTGPVFGPVDVLDDRDLLEGLGGEISVWHHHGDEVKGPPAGFRVLARSTACDVEALAADDRPWWGTQFHPEAWTDEHPAGRRILENFFRLAGIPLR
jgi:GMP synthase (glutamine-hydrolysing)